jgi:transcriptional regulator with GAF, ATPase, and Fis domain
VGPGKSGLRDDIVARLGAAPIHLPPLRNRIEDLGALSDTSWRACLRRGHASSSRRSAR